MLDLLTLENIGVIRRAQVEFNGGLTAITGETGAGKTMLLTGLNLLMGAKADRDIVRTGEAKAVVEGSWALPTAESGRSKAALQLVEEAGGNPDEDGTVVAARVITDSRSRAHLGGRTVPQNVLAQFSSELVTVHGQSDQARLRTARKQREALDDFAGPVHLSQLAAYQKKRRKRQADQAALDALTRDRDVRRQEAEVLRNGLAEIAEIVPQPGELAALDLQIARLTNVESLKASAGSAYQLLAGEPEAGGAEPAIGLVAAAQHELTISGNDDAQLEELAKRLAEAGYLLSDASAELARYLDDLEAEPAALEAAQQRRAQLQALNRRYGDPVAWREQAERRLVEVSDDDGRIEHLAQTIAATDTELAELAAALTQSRRSAAERLSRAVTAELHGLAMADARMDVSVTPTDLGPTGADEVTFLLTPHPGAVAAPVAKGASGGELSRVMLAVEVALAGGAGEQHPDALPTFIFDEVDAGVGGAAAVEVGSRLARLAQTTQVIVVTHMPQVAAFADHHLVVTKESDGTQTETAVAAVTGDDRVRELARMLSGKADSEAAKQHATELLTESRVR